MTKILTKKQFIERYGKLIEDLNLTYNIRIDINKQYKNYIKMRDKKAFIERYKDLNNNILIFDSLEDVYPPIFINKGWSTEKPDWVNKEVE